MNKPWRSLEEVSDLCALVPRWRQQAGSMFNLFRALCLGPMPEAAEFYPCPLTAACTFRVIRQPNQSITGRCDRDPRICEHISLTEADITPLAFNWQKFGRALCHALNLDFKFARMPFFQTAQIGTWSTDAVPVFLTIQNEKPIFHHVTADLVARIYNKFILIAPSDRLFDAYSLEHLNRVRAAFFPLDNIITMTEQGTLQPIITPGELFKAFTPQPKDIDKSAAERAFALVSKLDTETRIEPPSIMTVFRLYCIENQSVAKIAKKFDCSRQTIWRRLKLIETQVRVNPNDLRRVSSHLDSDRHNQSFD